MKNFLFLFFVIMIWFPVEAQDRVFGLKRLKRYQRYWLLTHPFVICKTYKLTKKALAATNEINNSNELDNDPNGGQVDAFRHSYWMALLAQHMRSQKAMKLGIAHEKDDYLLFKKKKFEDGALGDSLASAMDLVNNRIGVETGKANRTSSESELQTLIKQKIHEGKMTVLKKNTSGKYLDCDNHPIESEQWKDSWYKPKCLVPSDYQKKEIRTTE